MGKKVEEKLQNIEDIKVTDSKSEYYAKFFSDLNNNGIDDKTEEITVNFVTNIEEQIEPVKLNVGQKLKFLNCLIKTRFSLVGIQMLS